MIVADMLCRREHDDNFMLKSRLPLYNENIGDCFHLDGNVPLLDLLKSLHNVFETRDIVIYVSETVCFVTLSMS